MYRSYAFLQNHRSAFAGMQNNLDGGWNGYSYLRFLRPLRFHGRLFLLMTAYFESNLAELVERPVVEDC